MQANSSLYIEGSSVFHRMDSALKLGLLIIWAVATFLFLDVRIGAVMVVLGFGLLFLARIPWHKIRGIFYLVVGFNLLNVLFILVISPHFADKLVGDSTPLLELDGYSLSAQTLLYVATISMKYLSLFPVTLLFIYTTHPSQLASSLHRVGVPYKIAYAINIAFRYIPNIMQEYRTIVNAQQARGISFRKGEASFMQRARNLFVVILPLLISSLQRIDVVSNAMELRGFGCGRSRSWYHRKPLARLDWWMLLVGVLLIGLLCYLKSVVSGGFWFPG
ncbi:energy-coupling factor transporter transmembrane component T family protein [Dongshaea marina]|uniref:energy-coupling factor transporter transmembrane component T family protein n=1 Tax=Dongshaea marina TaxID=2047966 RepID=UPI000D3E1DFD|nr:energy-coupling factor transporter transmembrane component T [Dongshaea marina]